MDIIQAEHLGVYFKLTKGKKRSLRDTVTGVFNRGQNEAGKFWALRDVSFSIGEGETLGVIGRNGSGKSTLLRMISGIYTPDEGQIEVRGRISILSSTSAGFQPDLSGVENIRLAGVLMGLKEREIDALFDSIVDFAELDNFITMPVKTYSSGMYARLGFSIAVNVDNDVLLIDEVLGVGDAKFSEKCRQRMQELLTSGRTIVIASHDMETIRRFANKVIWLDKGIVAALGSPEAVIPQYLGQ